MTKQSDYTVVQADIDLLKPDDEQAWDGLFATQEGIANPFCAREWTVAWYRSFTEPSQRRLTLVWQDDTLVGVAPFFRDRVGPRRLPAAYRLQLVGAGQGGSLLELPQVLCAPGRERSVLRSVVAATMPPSPAESRVDWTEIAIPLSAGWFEPEWAVTGRPVSFYRQQLSRACVMLPLAGSWEATRSRLKRNVKESLRRSRNRLAKSGLDWAVHARSHDLDAGVVDRFLGLHQMRAEQEVSVRHPDAFADPRRRGFMRALLPRLGARGLATVYELQLDGQVMAAQLALHAPGLTYIHSSGFAAEIWDLGPVTHLQGEAISAAADRGERWVNLSPGPNVAKLRWSEQIEVHDDFAYGCGSKALRWRYGLFAAGQALAQTNHAIWVAGPTHDRDRSDERAEVIQVPLPHRRPVEAHETTSVQAAR